MAFNGVAVYDVFANEIGEDVSDIVSLVSPQTAGFLDDVGDAATPIMSKVYSWEEKSLLPDTYSNSSAIASAAGTAGGIEVGANASLLRAGDILQAVATNEMMKVSSVGTNAATIYVARGYAGTTATSLAAGATLNFLGAAVEEGSGTKIQRRVGKTLKSNFVQTFREEISISTLANNAKFKSAGQPDPFEEEKADKTIEVLKQLEKSVLMGRTNGNSIGADDKETTMAGIYNSIATNVVSHATFSNSILNEMMAKVDNFTDLKGNVEKYALYTGRTAFRLLSNSRSGRIHEFPAATEAGVRQVTNFMSDFGNLPVSYIRWLPAGSVLCIRKDFVKVAPFAGNSFQFKEYDNGNLAREGYVAGTYGVEFMQETAHGRLDGLSA